MKCGAPLVCAKAPASAALHTQSLTMLLIKGISRAHLRGPGCSRRPRPTTHPGGLVGVGLDLRGGTLPAETRENAPHPTPQPQGLRGGEGRGLPRVGRQVREEVKSPGCGPCSLGDSGQVPHSLCLSFLPRRITGFVS